MYCWQESGCEVKSTRNVWGTGNVKTSYQTATDLSLPFAVSSHWCGHSFVIRKEFGMSRHAKKTQKSNKTKMFLSNTDNVMLLWKFPTLIAISCGSVIQGKKKERNLSIAFAYFQRTIWFIYVPEARTTIEFLCRKRFLTLSGGAHSQADSRSHRQWGRYKIQ